MMDDPTQRDPLEGFFRQAAAERDAALDGAPVLPAARRAALRAGAARSFGSARAPRAGQVALAAALTILTLFALGPQPEGEVPDRPRPRVTSTASPLLLAPLPADASLLDEDDIRLDLVATANLRGRIFTIANDDRWPSVSDIALPGGSGL